LIVFAGVLAGYRVFVLDRVFSGVLAGLGEVVLAGVFSRLRGEVPAGVLAGFGLGLRRCAAAGQFGRYLLQLVVYFRDLGRSTGHQAVVPGALDVHPEDQLSERLATVEQ
jgi:hypothetical protein